MVPNDALRGRKILVTGAARGIGSALARRLHERGARVALAGLEPDQLEATASELDAPWWYCDVSDRSLVDDVVDDAARALGGLDVVVANAGVAAQMPIVDGDPAILERTIAVNVLGTYYTLRAAGPHIAHPGGYAVAVSSLAAAVHVPLMGAYSASKAAVEALGDSLRAELRPSGARVGVAYFAELDTEMTSRGFATAAARRLVPRQRVAPLSVGIDAIERGIARRSRIVVAPPWVAPLLPARALLQRAAELATRRGLAETLAIAREEEAPLTTPQRDAAGSATR